MYLLSVFARVITWIIKNACSDIHICYLVKWLLQLPCNKATPWSWVAIWWKRVRYKSRRSCFLHNGRNTISMHQAHKTIPGTLKGRMICRTAHVGGICECRMRMLTVREGHRGWKPWKTPSPYRWTNGVKAMIALVLPHLKNISLFNK